MNWLFPPFEPEDAAASPKRRFRPVSVRSLIPNLITLLALCMGLTAIRMGIEARYELAVAAIVAAAVLDSLDGLVARLLKSTSRFGAELDSLADFVNFGVAPAVLLYNWSLVELKSAGWIGVLVFSLCGALRLARFNVALDRPLPAWTNNFFVGMPAPAGAITLLLPLYIDYLGIAATRAHTLPILVYTGMIAFLMVSRVPTFSAKSIGLRVPRDMVLPLFVVVVVFFAVLLSFPWLTLAAGTLLYLASLPFSILRFRVLSEAAAEKKPAEGTQEEYQPGESRDEQRPPKLH